MELINEYYAQLMIRSAISVVVILCAYYLWRRPKNQPPGPRGLPVLGIVPFLGKFPERTIRDWSKKYGPIMSVRMGMGNCVVLNDYESVTEGLVKHKELTSGRPSDPSFDIIGEKGYGLGLLDYTPLFKQERKFGLTTLRGFGMGKKSMEDRVLEEVDYLIQSIQEAEGKPFDIKKNLTNAISNNICSIVFGKRFEYSDPKFETIIYHLIRGASDPKSSRLSRILTFAPFLKYVPPFSQNLRELQHDMEKTRETVKRIIEEHRATLDIENPRDFIDAYLIEAEKVRGGQFSAKQLVHYCHDLFFAGTETTTSTLRWAIITMLHYPETQRKLREEIVRTLGTASLPTMSHRAQMPYTSAFMEELYRFRTLAPLSLPHKATEDVTIGAYEAAKGTTIFPNLWAVHNDPLVWKNPENFDPQRHLDAKGQFVKSKHVIPFSVGPRHCLGEQLARMEVFLFLVSLIQKFEFLPAPEGLPDIEAGSPGLGYIPSPFTVIAKEV